METSSIIIEHRVKEECHWHVYHGCNWNGNRCRCAGFRRFDEHRRPGLARRHIRIDEFGEKEAENFLNYYTRIGYRVLHAATGAKILTGLFSRYKDLQQHEGLLSEGSIGAMEMCRYPYEGVPEQDEASQNHETDDPIAQVNYAPAEKRRRIHDIKIKRNPQMIVHAQLKEAIMSFACVPFASTCTIPQWVNHQEFSFYDKSDNVYNRAVSVCRRETCTWNFYQFQQYYRTIENPVWLSGGRPEYYYSLDESIQHINDLLRHQYSTEEKVRVFIRTLFDIVEKKRPKLNSMFVLGKANCGKTWFFDCLTSYYLNVGYVNNFVRGENFPLNDCPERRILLWNEPSIQQSSYDTVKMLAGGDPCPAKVKYQSGAVVYRTPLIFTSNNNIFPKSPEWTSRISFETWSPAPFLKDLTKKPSPYVIEYLYAKYYIN